MQIVGPKAGRSALLHDYDDKHADVYFLGVGRLHKRRGIVAGSRSGDALLDRTFRITLTLKGLDGALELIGGVLLLLVSPQQIGDVARLATQHELAQDPGDPLAGAILHAASTASLSAPVCGAIYLLLHGLVKVVLVWAVLRDKLWAYPWMIAFLLVFILYQLYRIFAAFSWGMVLLTVFDIFIVWITAREQRRQRLRRTLGQNIERDPAATPS